MGDFNFKFDLLKVMKTPINLNIARKYNSYENVKSFKIEKVFGGYKITGVVEVLKDCYESVFIVNHQGEFREVKCNCAFCVKNNPCAHIGAILIKINTTHIDELPFEYNRDKQSEDTIDLEEYIAQCKEEENRRRLEKEERERRAREAYMEKVRKEEEKRERQRIQSLQAKTDSLISSQKNNTTQHILSHFDSTIYSLYPEILEDEYGEYRLGYRIGTANKKYVVRNISDLVYNFAAKETLSYGKNVTICHDEQRFDEFSRQQIHFLEKLEARPHGSYNYWDHQKIGRYIDFDGSIPGLRGEFFNLYQGHDESYNFRLVDVKKKIKCSFEKEMHSYTLRLIVDFSFALEGNAIYTISSVDNHYLFERMVLDPQRAMHNLLLQWNRQDGVIYIHPSQFDEFNKYILKPIESYLEIEGELPETSKTMLYDNIKVYGDVDEYGKIIFDVNYLCDGELIPAFSEGQPLDFKQEVVETVLKEYASSVEPGKAYFDSNNEKTIKFCSSEVEKLQPYCEIYVSDNLKRIGQKGKQTITVGVRVDNDLISLDISSLEIPKEELASVLSSYRRKKKFYRLKSGEMINIDSDEMEALDQLMDDYHLDIKDLKNDEIKLNKYRMFELDETAKQETPLLMNKEASYQHLLDNFKEISLSDIQVPESYQEILRDYQKDGYRWLYTLYQYGFNGILADDMGLGKTLQVIALLEGIQSKLPSIVVCPASLVYNWEDEVHKFSQKLNVVCVVGTKSQRQQIIDKAYQYDLLVTSYDYMRRDYDLYQRTQFEYIILDEAQNIKNQKTKNAESVKSLHGNHRLALTGTPIENTLAELWSIFDFLMPDYLFNYHYFKKNYETPIVKNGATESSDKLKRMVSPFILRRNKKEVLSELPDKIETVQVIPFEENENKLYLANLSQINEQLAEMMKVENVDKFMILAMLTRLRQLCIEPRMVYENITQTSSKMKALLELLIQLKENHQKTLVFSAFPSVFNYIEEDLKKENISYMELTGSNSKEERREMVEKFQNEDIDVFLISLKAGGTGLNLTKASAVVHIDPWWNLSAQNQATDRAHRIGQENIVQVFKLVMKNSIEEKIVKLQEKKKELADLFVENNEANIASMTKQEMIDLFKMD